MDLLQYPLFYRTTKLTLITCLLFHVLHLTYGVDSPRHSGPSINLTFSFYNLVGRTVVHPLSEQECLLSTGSRILL